MMFKFVKNVFQRIFPPPLKLNLQSLRVIYGSPEKALIKAQEGWRKDYPESEWIDPISKAHQKALDARDREEIKASHKENT